MSYDITRSAMVGAVAGAINYGFDIALPGLNQSTFGGSENPMQDGMTTAAGVFTGKFLNSLVASNMSMLPGAIQNVVVSQNTLVQPALYGAGRYIVDKYYYHTGESSMMTAVKGAAFGVAGDMVEHMFWANQPSAQ